MKTAAPTTFPARLGRTLGRAWRGCARMDRRAKGWLLAQGWAPNVVKTVLLVVKLTVIGILFYTAFLAHGTSYGCRNLWCVGCAKP